MRLRDAPAGVREGRGASTATELIPVVVIGRGRRSFDSSHGRYRRMAKRNAAFISKLGYAYQGQSEVRARKLFGGQDMRLSARGTSRIRHWRR